MFLMAWRCPETAAAHHGLELPLLFGCPEQASAAPEARGVSEQIIAAWSSFMRGEAAAVGLPWPAYDAERRATLRVGVEATIDDAPLEPERAVWQGLDQAWSDFAHGR